MTVNLDSLLYVSHEGNVSSSGDENIYLRAASIMTDLILYNKRPKLKKKYNEGFQKLLDVIKNNLDKSLFVIESDGYIYFNPKYKKMELYYCLKTALLVALTNIPDR